MDDMIMLQFDFRDDMLPFFFFVIKDESIKGKYTACSERMTDRASLLSTTQKHSVVGN